MALSRHLKMSLCCAQWVLWYWQIQTHSFPFWTKLQKSSRLVPCWETSMFPYESTVATSITHALLPFVGFLPEGFAYIRLSRGKNQFSGIPARRGRAQNQNWGRLALHHHCRHFLSLFPDQRQISTTGSGKARRFHSHRRRQKTVTYFYSECQNVHKKRLASLGSKAQFR